MQDTGASNVATKTDMAEMRTEMAQLKGGLETGMAELNGKLETGMTELGGGIDKIAELFQKDMKWMKVIGGAIFSLWVALIVGFVVALLKMAPPT